MRHARHNSVRDSASSPSCWPPDGDFLKAVVDKNADCVESHIIVDFLSEKGHGVLIGHVVVECLQRVRSAASTRGREVRARVLSDALAFCRTEIPRRARERDAQTFSMLIDNVRSRLRGEHASAAFADALFAAFPAALIDEFQDTDGRQFDIFDAIYRDRAGNTRGLLTMIGDPKQAIYGFRGGDLAAYLRARKSADAGFALTVNSPVEHATDPRAECACTQQRRAASTMRTSATSPPTRAARRMTSH